MGTKAMTPHRSTTLSQTSSSAFVSILSQNGTRKSHRYWRMGILDGEGRYEYRFVVDGSWLATRTPKNRFPILLAATIRFEGLTRSEVPHFPMLRAYCRRSKRGTLPDCQLRHADLLAEQMGHTNQSTAEEIWMR